MLTVVPLGLDLNPGEDMDVCKCIVPSRNGDTLNSSRVASPLVRLVEGEESCEGLIAFSTQLKTPLWFFWAEMANSFQPNPEAKRDYAN
ncbi:hypothetical protein TNCV_1541071 [Trichonephila clavipes]|nr:hypothetical protein TNCV_1541071 [Trichonephila clavipes]